MKALVSCLATIIGGMAFAMAQPVSNPDVNFTVEWEKAPKKVEASAQYGMVERTGPAKKRSSKATFVVKDPSIGYGPEATIISIKNGAESFSFFLRDVNSESPIWIPEYGVVVLPASDSRSYEEVVGEIRSRDYQSKIDRIESEEEASFEAAEKVTRSMSAPIWLGISRDIRRFEVVEELEDALSTVQHEKTVTPTMAWGMFADPRVSDQALRYNYSFGRGVGPYSNIRRSLEDGVLPICNSVLKDDDVVYHSRSFVGFEKTELKEENVKGTHFMISDKYSGGRVFTESQARQLEEVLASTPEPDEETVLFIRTTITNEARVPRYAWYKIPYANFWGGDYSYDPGTGFSSFKSGIVYCISTMDGKPVANEEMAVLLEPGQSIEIDFRIPHKAVDADRARKLAARPFEECFQECKSYWQKKLDDAAKIQVPETRIQNMIRAGLLHLDLITYGDRDQGTLAANVGTYSPIGTESSPIIQFYESMGMGDQARRCLQYFIDTQQEDGRIVNFFGYTIETGAVLWTIGEHYRYTRDKEWIASIKPQLLKACRYLEEWREKSMKEELRGCGYGMVDGKVADPEDNYHQFMLNGYSYLGFKRMAEVFRDMGFPEADELEAIEKEWLANILESYRNSIASSPVVPLYDGSWCPTCAPWAESPTARFFLEKPEKYRSHGTFMAPDALLGPIHLLFTEVLDPRSREGQMLLKYYRDITCQDNSSFSQPYYSKHNMIQARLGQVKPFLNTYYYTVAPHFDHETGTFWEHYFKQSVHKTHEEGNFLMETRNMLYMEASDTLKLLSVIPRRWMEDGKKVVLDGVNSYFGSIEFQAGSHVSEGFIEATVRCDTDRKPSVVTIRLPHPDGRKATGVSAGEYDPETESVTLSNFSGSATIRLRF